VLLKNKVIYEYGSKSNSRTDSILDKVKPYLHRDISGEIIMGIEKDMGSYWSDVTEFLDAFSVELEDRALNVSSDFWRDHIKRNRTLQLKDRGLMGCRVRIKGENRSVYAEWYRTMWIRTNNGPKPLAKYITKGRTDPYGYSLKKLGRLSKQNEWQRVLEAETAFRIIREQNQCLALIRKYLKQIERAEQKWVEEICSEFDDLPDNFS